MIKTNPLREELIFKYEGEFREIEWETVIQSQKEFLDILNDLTEELGVKLNISLKALDQGSIRIVFDLSLIHFIVSLFKDLNFSIVLMIITGYFTFHADTKNLSMNL